MKDLKGFSHASTAALLDGLGLQTRVSKTTRAATYAGFIAAGVVVGAATALLFAPKTGRQLRADLRGGARQLSDQASAKATSVVDAVKHRYPSLESDGEIPHGN
jgi:hypothetical protein